MCGTNTMFTDTVKGHGETLYCHCAKHCVPRLTKEFLEQLGCGVGIYAA